MAKKKKYYPSTKMRMAESRGMERKLRGPVRNGEIMYYDREDRYYDMNPEVRRQMEDSRMINEDRNAIANLPQDVKYHEWPKTAYVFTPKIDDTLRGVDKQINADMKKYEEEFSPDKY